MQSESQASVTQIQRSRKDAQSKNQLPDAQSMTDNSRAMSAIVQAASVLQSLMPGTNRLSNSQQTSTANYSAAANQPVSFSLAANQTSFGIAANQQPSFNVNATQGGLPYVNLAAASPVGAPILSQSSGAASPASVLPNGNMLTILGSPQSRKAVSSGDGVAVAQTPGTATHYAALLPKPAGYSRVAVKPTTNAKHTTTSGKSVSYSKPGSSGDLESTSKSNEVQVKPTRVEKTNLQESSRQRSSAPAGAQRGQRRTIVCKRQFAPLHIQPHPAVATGAATAGAIFAQPTFAANAQSSFSASNAAASSSTVAPQTPSGNFVANTLTAFLTPATNTLHILSLGAIEQLAQLQQAVANVNAVASSVPNTPTASSVPTASTGFDSAQSVIGAASPKTSSVSASTQQTAVRIEPSDAFREQSSTLVSRDLDDDDDEVGLQIVDSLEVEEEVDEDEKATIAAKRKRQRPESPKRSAKKRAKCDSSEKMNRKHAIAPSNGSDAEKPLKIMAPDSSNDAEADDDNAQSRRGPGRPRKGEPMSGSVAITTTATITTTTTTTTTAATSTPSLSKHPLRLTIITTDRRNFVAASSRDAKKCAQSSHDGEVPHVELKVENDIPSTPAPILTPVQNSNRRKNESATQAARRSRTASETQSPKRRIIESARHVIDGFVIYELDSSVDAAMMRTAYSPKSTSPTRVASAQPPSASPKHTDKPIVEVEPVVESPNRHKANAEREPQRRTATAATAAATTTTSSSTKLRCVVCGCDAELRLDADDPDAVRRVRRLIELGVCSYRCKQKFLSKREKIKRDSLVRRLEQLDSLESAQPTSTSATVADSVAAVSKPRRISNQQRRMMNALSKRGGRRLGLPSKRSASTGTGAATTSTSGSTSSRRLGRLGNDSDADGVSQNSSESGECDTLGNSPDLLANIRRTNQRPAISTARPRAKVKRQQPESERDGSEEEMTGGGDSRDISTLRCTRSQTRRDITEVIEPNLSSSVPGPASTSRFGASPTPTKLGNSAPSNGAPAKLKSPPVALVSPSNSLLTPTSLSEMSSSVFSPTFSRRSTTEDGCGMSQPNVAGASGVRSSSSQIELDAQSSAIGIGEEKWSSDPSKWSVDQVCEFLRSRPWLAEYAAHFRANEIDGHALALLHVDHLVGTLRMKLGPALKLHDLVSRLKTTAAAAATVAAGITVQSPPPQQQLQPLPQTTASPSTNLSLPLSQQHSDSDDELNVEDL